MAGQNRDAHEKSKRHGGSKGKRGANREFAVVTYSFLAIFLCLMGYFAYFQFFKAEDFINNPYNKRQDIFVQHVVRGDIRSADGVTLAETLTDGEGNETRNYPCGRIFSHVVGYSTRGNSGLEAMENFSLLRSNVFYMERAVSDLKGEKSPGDTVITTLNYDMQLRAYDALGQHDGAVVVMEPETGNILAMVSKPDFDPNTIARDWDEIVSEESDGAALLNRATQGLYPPGSTFKIITALAYMRQNPDYADFSYSCDGTFTKDNKTIHCHGERAHGQEDLAAAFANSCNSAFAAIGTSLDVSDFAETADGMLFNSALPIRLESSKSSFVLSEGDGTSSVMETSIGQGKTLVTPMHMALVASAIANGGVLMEPQLIAGKEDGNGNEIDRTVPKERAALLSPDEASALQELMRGVVERGTAKALQSDLYEAAGKTGSAEFSSTDDTHSWFVGYARGEGRPDVAVSVIVEAAGIGSDYAVPIAKEIFDDYFDGED